MHTPRLPVAKIRMTQAINAGQLKKNGAITASTCTMRNPDDDRPVRAQFLKGLLAPQDRPHWPLPWRPYPIA